MFDITKRSKHFMFILISTMVIIYLCNIFKYSSHYRYVLRENEWHELVKKVSKNVTFTQTTICEYSSVLVDNRSVDIEEFNTGMLKAHLIREGGEYHPQTCTALFSSAIIIPYRNREKQLSYIVPYLHHLLMTQNIHYRIYVVEQDKGKLFNKGTMFNIASVVAMYDGFPCIILHNVDLLPIKYDNIYACSRLPRHMSSSVDAFRYNLPYTELVGGVISLLSEQLVAVNGFSNSYWGWGGIDDEFQKRLANKGLIPVRFQSSVSAYVMMKQPKTIPSSDTWNIFKEAPKRFTQDGLNSVKYNKIALKLRPLFTHIFVQL